VRFERVKLVGTRVRGRHYGQRLMCAASTGRTHGRTDQLCRTIQIPLAKGEPSTSGDNVMIGGQTAIADHIKIGSNARIAARSGIMRDVPEGETWGGAPAVPIREWHRQTATLARLIRRKSKHV
jgi:acetyltransferase-like isoleucine patch superfamily enzyme